jgi:glucose-1-phosphate adenylyltransferase
MTQVTQHAYAFVLAGGRGTRLHQLTDNRSKPAVPFAGQLRIIDFALSNCINSGIRRVGVLTQYKAQSLIRHIERAWGFLEINLGEFVDIVPAQQKAGEQWYEGTADAAWQNLDLLREARADLVLVLAGDHVYKMDYSRILAEHAESGADVTVACTEVPRAEASAFGVVHADAQGRITSFIEKPADPPGIPGSPDRSFVSMGIYVFGSQLLADELARDASDPTSNHDFGRNLLPSLVPRMRVMVHRFANSCVNLVGGEPYWRDVGTVDAYYEANIDLTHVVPELNLYDDDWPILSRQRQLAPAKFVLDGMGRRGHAIDSLVASGCIVSGGEIRRSILFSKVRVDEGSTVEDSVLLPNVKVGRGVHLRRCVVDSRCELPDGLHAGFDAEADRQRFHVSERGVVLIAASMLGSGAPQSADGPAADVQAATDCGKTGR